MSQSASVARTTNERAAASAARLAAFALVYSLAVWLGWQLVVPLPSGSVPAIWPASGIALAGFFLFAGSERPILAAIVFAATLVFSRLSRVALDESLSAAVIQTASVVGVAWLLWRVWDGAFDFYRVSHVLSLVGAAMLTLAPIAIVGAFLGWIDPGSALGTQWPTWWEATGLGMQFVCPLALTWLVKPMSLRWPDRARRVEVAAFCLVSCALLAVFLFSPGFSARLLFGALIVFPLLLWSALRFDSRLTTLALAALYAVVMVNAAHGAGVFQLIDPSAAGRIQAAAGYVCTASLTGLLVAAAAVERRQAQAALRESEATYRRMFFDHLATAMLIDPASGVIVDANSAASRFYGYPLEALRGMNISQVNMLSQPEIAERMNSARETAANYFQFPHRLASGEIRQVDVYSSPIQIGGRTLLYSIVHDVTDRQRLQQELERQRDFAQQIMTAMGQGLIVADADWLLEYVNPAFAQMLGYAAEELVRRHRIGEFFADPDLWTETRALRLQNKSSTYQALLLRKDGTTVPTLITGVPRWYDGQFAGDIAVVTNLTEQKRVEDQLKYSSTHDALTGLCNFAYFNAEVSRLETHGLYPVTVMMADVDNMKPVNDRLGHSAGDELLRRAGRVLSSGLRAGDTVARLGGDEFSVLLPNTDAQAAGHVLARIRAAVAYYCANQPDLPLRLSIGMATATNGPLARAITLADTQMYANKRTRKSDESDAPRAEDSDPPL